MTSRQWSRRDVLAAMASAGVGVMASSTTTSADHEELGPPEEVTLSYDESTIQEYLPGFVLEGVEPEPLTFHALHAESEESTLNCVYGFMQYPYQEGQSRHDSHLGDHEPLIVWYDQSTGDVARTDYAGYHWFRATALPSTLTFVDDAQHRIKIRPDPSYHHYYTYSGDIPAENVETKSLLDSIERWLDNGLEENLAVSQPFDPYEMLSRKTWWAHTAGNYVDASLKALWFNLGLSGANETSDLQEVKTW